MIPDCARAFGRNEKVILRNPSSVRPWQHVLEPLRFYLLVAEKAHRRENVSPAYNVGPRPEEVATVEDVMNWFTQYWPHAPGWQSADIKNSPHESLRLILKTDLAEKSLRWQPQIPLQKGIELTACWYQMYYQGKDHIELLNYTKKQIYDWGLQKTRENQQSLDFQNREAQL